MKFQTQIDEAIFVSEIIPGRSYMFDEDLRKGLSIVWNRGVAAQFRVDNELVTLQENCVVFLTEFYNIEDFEFELMNVIQFNRQFYCVEDNDELGCRGALFFGASHVPKIILPAKSIRQFELLWEAFVMEMDEEDGFKLEMLKGLLQRFLILCIRAYKKQNHNLPMDNVSMGLIREYNYLVGKNFKRYSKVSDYAKLLHKSPKTLSNVFRKYVDKTPLQVINDRRLLEAKRLLKYTDAGIQEIAEELNFRDVPSFSHFFHVREEVSPSVFRKSDK